jgi:hemerythrin
MFQNQSSLTLSICRLDGDEFFIICPDTDHDSGMHIAALCMPTGDGVWHGSISIGLASRPPDMESHEDLIKAADKSAYEAKRGGRNCVRTIC